MAESEKAKDLSIGEIESITHTILESFREKISARRILFALLFLENGDVISSVFDFRSDAEGQRAMDLMRILYRDNNGYAYSFGFATCFPDDPKDKPSDPPINTTQAYKKGTDEYRVKAYKDDPDNPAEHIFLPVDSDSYPMAEFMRIDDVSLIKTPESKAKKASNVCLLDLVAITLRDNSFVVSIRPGTLNTDKKSGKLIVEDTKAEGAPH